MYVGYPFCLVFRVNASNHKLLFVQIKVKNFIFSNYVNVKNMTSYKKDQLQFKPYFFGDLTNKRHFVKRQLVFPGRALHDCCQEGLRIEESGQPDRRR